MPPGNWIGRCKAHADTRSCAKQMKAPERLGKTASTAQLSWVTDRARFLDAEFKTEMARTLAAFHAETCHTLFLVTTASLEGQPIEAYSLALANDLGLGYARFNNGLMLLVAPNDRRARIEVGCGLEDVVTDAAAAEIMAQRLVPAFRSGSYAGGIREGMRELMLLTRRKIIPPAYRPKGCRERAGS
jgi:uncharacterized protein